MSTARPPLAFAAPVLRGQAFRERLERDPRRWVLLLAALEGLAALAFDVQERRAWFFGRGVGLVVLLGFAVLAPAAGVLGMIAHGRLLLWTGKLLGGRAARHDLHAAFAWSQLPLVVASAPLVLELPLRAAAAELDAAPRWLSAALAGLDRASDVLAGLVVLAALAGVLLYVRFVAGAQRFSVWRALANHVLAGLLGGVCLFAGVLAAHRLQPGAAPFQLLPLSLALSVAPPLAVERLVLWRRARRARA